MNCISCGGLTRIVDSRNSNDGKTTYRKHKCAICGRYFYTEEKLSSTFETAKQMNDIIKKYRRRKNNGIESVV